MGSFSNYLETAWLNHTLKGTSFTKPAGLYLSLHTANPDEDASGAEVANSNNYSRTSCLSQFGTAASTKSISNDGDITCPTASGSWGTVSHWALWDSGTYGGGNMLVYGAFTTPKAIGNGQTPKVLTGEIVISITASNGMTTYLANEMLDHTFLSGDGGFSQPTNLYVGLGTADFADTGVWTNEVADSGAYARVNVNSWTVAAGAASNTGAITFTTATGSWGTVSDHFISDNSAHATGNMYYYGDLDSSVAVTTDDQVTYAIGDFDLTLD